MKDSGFLKGHAWHSSPVFRIQEAEFMWLDYSSIGEHSDVAH